MEQLNNAKFELQDTKRALDKNDANTKRELEMALRALAAEKTANDLLHGDMAGHKAEVEALTSEVKALKSFGNSSKSEVNKLQSKLKAFEIDNGHLHESLNEYMEVHRNDFVRRHYHCTSNINLLIAKRYSF